MDTQVDTWATASLVEVQEPIQHDVDPLHDRVLVLVIRLGVPHSSLGDALDPA